MDNNFIGSNFDNFLIEENMLVEAEALALKRIIAFTLEEAIKEQKLNKSQVAKKMKTSRIAFDRLLDPNNTSVTLKSLEKAAIALGKKVHFELRSL